MRHAAYVSDAWKARGVDEVALAMTNLIHLARTPPANRVALADGNVG
jgi:hypothetical protein